MISMQPTALQKITARHLSRQAMLYVRQSTLHQVLENTESTARQYGLRERAMALGWEASRIVVIDQDLGQSGASAVDRVGFQRLVAEVGLGHVGLVMGLEVSRLARSSLDWHHLLEICTMTGTLILDEDGLYDPATFNDRLLLGLKGTMSEAELHVLQARLKGGILHKASRAALKVPLPVGLAYAEDQTVILNPDAQIQQALRLLFATFKRTGSACATVRYFRDQGLLFPRRVHIGPHAGEIHWMPLQHNAVLKALRNPRYAGAFCFGRTHTTKHADGSLHIETLPQEQWLFLVREVHAGYLNWQEYEANLAQLRANRQAQGDDRRHGPPREGPALLQGLVIAVHVRFKGGVQQSITVPLSRGRRSTPELIALIDQLLDDYTDAEVAEQLTQRGWRTYEGKPFTAARVLSLRRYQQLKDHGTRLAERGLLTASEAASAYGVCRETLMVWGRAGLLPMYRINDQGTAVFPPPDEHAPVKNAHKYQKTRSSCARSAVCN